MSPNPCLQDQKVIEALDALPRNEPQTIALCGLSGAGKTTLAKALTKRFAPRALHVSEDDFLFIPTETRKSYLRKALASGDKKALAELASPKNPQDNPYADPRSWYDWEKLRHCLKELRAQRPFEIANAWDQETGTCTRSVRYEPSKEEKPLIFLDINYPLAVEEMIDKIVLLDIAPHLAAERQKTRDTHRSEDLYFFYKRLLDEIYCIPLIEKIRPKADWILTQNR